MAISYSYPMGTPKLTDTVLGMQYEEMKDPAVKNFSIGDIVTLAVDEVGIPTLQQVTGEGANTSIQMQINGVDVATTSDIPTPAYKVYTALLTQTGANGPAILSNSSLTIGVTYQIKTGSTGPFDFTNVGAINNNIGTSFVATGTTPNNWASAALNYNTGAPVAKVLENTIGNIWFTYNGEGSFSLFSNGLFILNKSTGMIGSASEGVLNGALSSIINAGINTFGIDTAVIISGVPTPFNDELQLTPVEIRVYN